MKPFDISGRLICLDILRRRRLSAHTSGRALYPGQLHLLNTIIRDPGLTQQALAAHLGVTAASVAQSVRRMENTGLLLRREDASDRRRNRLYATERGRAAAELYRSGFDEIDEKMLSGIPEEALASFRSVLDRMLDNLKTQDFDYSRFLAQKGAIRD